MSTETIADWISPVILERLETRKVNLLTFLACQMLALAAGIIVAGLAGVI
jgi:hypothetical protein